MAKKKKPSRRPGEEEFDQVPKQKPVTFSPFKDLKKMLADKAAANGKPQTAAPASSRSPVKPAAIRPTQTPTAAPPGPDSVDEAAMLREAYAGVRPFGEASAGHRM